MADVLDYKAQVTRCKEMAKQAVTPQSQAYWLRMAEYWLHRSSESQSEPSAAQQQR